jgi:hypothetical protein
MQTETIELSVPADVARLFRSATPEQRQKAGEQIAQAIRYALMSHRQAVEEFERISNEMGAYAKSQGLTEEKLEELLKEDDK